MADEDKDRTPTLEELQAQLTTLQKSLTDKDSKISELEGSLDEDRKEMIRKRDEAKEAERKALEDNEKFQELYLKTKKEFEEYRTTYSEEKYNEAQKRLDDIVKAQKERLLGQLPEDDRELFSDMDIPKLEKLVEKLGGAPVGVDASTGQHKSNSPKKWKDMSDKERLDLTSADPAKARELIIESKTNK